MNFINTNNDTIDFKSKLKYTFMIQIFLIGIDFIIFSIYIINVILYLLY